MTLVDTNVLLDLVTDDPVWADWSVAQLETASLAGPLLINDVIYAELAVRYERIEELDAFIEEAGLELTSLPRAALFLAGKVFTHYRRAGGSRTGVLPDFFIGAQAAVQKLPLLTRDIGRYRTYFPTVELITPGS
ncbi:type II toxin-antitoxin system VapC family toxin [Rhizobium puerariae]|uniref:Type II toxin-antitoxin system VapC family toxin n=1 Tax=Rhizobium puerariae TaxID=1585791 RepID=A0ABV6AMJ2_9HYPH